MQTRALPQATEAYSKGQAHTIEFLIAY